MGWGLGAAYTPTGVQGQCPSGGSWGAKPHPPQAKNDFKVSRAHFSSPETYLHIFKLQFNRKTAFKY